MNDILADALKKGAGFLVMRRQDMALTAELIEEINVLTHYNLESTQEGIKVHGSAKPEVINATKRLFEKGLVSQSDGGYLTDLGLEAAEHAQAVLRILS